LPAHARIPTQRPRTRTRALARATCDHAALTLRLRQACAQPWAGLGRHWCALHARPRVALHACTDGVGAYPRSAASPRQPRALGAAVRSCRQCCVGCMHCGTIGRETRDVRAHTLAAALGAWCAPGRAARLPARRCSPAMHIACSVGESVPHSGLRKQAYAMKDAEAARVYLLKARHRCRDLAGLQCTCAWTLTPNNAQVRGLCS